MSTPVSKLRGLFDVKKLFFYFVFFCSVFISQAQVVYVNSGSGCVAGCGDSWANAYSDLKEAIQATDSGEIWVAKGTYRPADCPGTCQNIDRLETFQLKSNVAIYGGFFGDETALEQRDIAVNETILSGNIGFGIAQNDNSFHVVVASNVDSTAVLDGFTVRDGLADGTFGTNNEKGAGLYISAGNMGESAPVIRNCVFTANVATGGGGAIYVEVAAGSSGSPTIEDCDFRENTTEAVSSGGAIAHNVVEGGILSPIYRNLYFENNEAGDNGGALAFFSSNLGTISAPKISNCTFVSNLAESQGGAIYSRTLDNAVHQGIIESSFFNRNEVLESGGAVYDQASFGSTSTTRFLNNHFKENGAAGNGGAVYIRGSQDGNNFSLFFNTIFEINGTAGNGAALYTTSALDGADLGVCRPRVINCTFYGNSAEEEGDALYNEFSNTELYNSILWNNDSEIGNDNANPTVRNCIVKGGYDGPGTFSAIYEDDPAFLFPEQGDFHLSYCSPAIDVGLVANIPIDSTDLDTDNNTTETIDVDADNAERIFGSSVDLGALEWNGTPAAGEVIFVKLDASGANNGTSWDDAYTDLQSALAQAYPCADIWVAAGEYKPVTCPGSCTLVERAVSFNMKNNVGIYGGFKGTESLLDERDIDANETILSGNIGDVNDAADNAFHVVFANAVDSTGILDGFTISGGNANSGTEEAYLHGGGLYVDGSGTRANPTIRNCTFRNNQAKGEGGAVYHDAGMGGIVNTWFENCSFENNGSVIDAGAIYQRATHGGSLGTVYHNCTFSANTAQENGGAFVQEIMGSDTEASIQIFDCTFESNIAAGDAGAIFAEATDGATHQLIIQNCSFLDNSASRSAGAVFDGTRQGGSSTSRLLNVDFDGNKATVNGGALVIQGVETGTNRTLLFNTLFNQNTADQSGGAIYNAGAVNGANTGNCEPTIINGTFSGNVAQSGQAIYNDFANPEINNSIMWNGGDEIVDNEAAPIVQNCVIEGGYEGDGFVSNIIEMDPLFLDPDGGDFRLVACSPAIDEGLTGVIPPDLTDVDSDDNNVEQIDIDLQQGVRLFNGQIDLGAFEWSGFPAALTMEVEKVDVSCFGFCDGQVSIDPEGGTGDFVVSWSDGQEVFEASNLCPGDYEITVADGSRCTVVDSVEIIENEELDLVVTPDTTVCEGTEAPLTALGTGGAGGYTYLWSGNLGETGSVSFTPSEDQEVIVIVTDNNGCLKIDSIDVAVADNPVPSITGDMEVCAGDSVMLQTETFASYAWSSGEETQVISVGEAGAYEVTVTDDNGCTGTSMVDVVDLPVPEPMIEGDTAFCSGGSTTLMVGDFAAYEWSTGGSEASETFSEAGPVVITVTNAEGCTGQATANLLEYTTPIVEISGNLSFCEGDSTLLESAAFAAYAWSTGDTTSSVFATTAGTYQLTVTDDNGCEAESSVEVDASDSPEVSIQGDPQFCTGDSTLLEAGTFAAYEWSTGEETSTIQADAGEEYSVTVTNEDGCTGSASIMVVENALPEVTIDGMAGFCPGDSTMLDAGDFAAHEWSTGDLTQTIQVMESDTYQVTVTDENGCSNQASIEVMAFAEPVVDIMGDLVFCEGDSTILEAGDFVEYAWTGGVTTPTLSVLAGGNYGLTVTDENGCEAENMVEVTENPMPEVIIEGEDVLCTGDSTELSAAGFESYLWSTDAETSTINVDQAGTYTVSVTDTNGCTGTASQEVTELIPPEPEIDGLLSFCNGASTTLTTGDFAGYEWSTGDMMAEITVMEAGPYSVTVEDANGCLGTTSVEITEAEEIQVEIMGPLSFCNGDSTQLDAGDFAVYEWSTGDLTATIFASTAGTYAVTVTDTLGCTGESSVEVMENDLIEVSIEGELSICEGNSTMLSAGPGFETYEWSTTDTGIAIEVTSSGTYTVTVTDTDGCTATAAVEVETAPALMPEISGNLEICEGEVTVLAVDEYENYLWSTGATTATIETTVGGNFAVTVTDENGCNGEAAVLVNATGLPQPEILGVTDGICAGESVELLAAGNGEFSWIDTDGSLDALSPDVAVASPDQPVTYGLAVTNSCFSDTVFVELQLFDPPVIDAGSDVVIKEDEEVRLEATGATSYEWSNAQFLSCVACSSPLATPDSTTTFVATGTDANGCQGVDSVTVAVLTGDVKLVDPVNAFTPNNDGVNDFFVIKEIEQFSDHKLTIFNRWGDTVFESLDYQNDWDGTYNGELLPAGTYLYVLVINVAGTKEVIKSTITIVRE